MVTVKCDREEKGDDEQSPVGTPSQATAGAQTHTHTHTHTTEALTDTLHKLGHSIHSLKPVAASQSSCRLTISISTSEYGSGLALQFGEGQL